MIQICDGDVSSARIRGDLISGVRRQTRWRANRPAGSPDFVLAFLPHSGSLDMTSTVSARTNILPVYILSGLTVSFDSGLFFMVEGLPP